MDLVIASKELQVERKTSCIEMRENLRGRFSPNTEEAHERRSVTIIPSIGLNEFMAAEDEVCATVNEPVPV